MRTVYVMPNDSLPRIAARELADATMWRVIADLNALASPYISEDAQILRQNGIAVLAPGEPILLPDGTATASRTPAQAEIEVYGQDHAWGAGLLALQKDDITQQRGITNLRVALERRLSTRKGALILHPNYGNSAYQHLGEVADDWRIALIIEDCKECLLADPRVQTVNDVRVEWSESAFLLEVNIKPVPPAEPLIITARVL